MKNRIREIRIQRGLSQQKLAEMLDTTNQYIGQLENGKRRLKYEWIARIADALGVSPGDLFPGAGSEETKEDRAPSSTKRHMRTSSEKHHRGDVSCLPEYDVQVSAGHGAFVDHEHVIGEWCLPTEMIRGFTKSPINRLGVITMVGDSMEPTLRSGTKLVVDLDQTTPSPPGLFVVYDGMGTVCKRLDIIQDRKGKPKGIRIISDNSHYTPYERDFEEVTICGRVVAWLCQA